MFAAVLEGCVGLCGRDDGGSVGEDILMLDGRHVQPRDRDVQRRNRNTPDTDTEDTSTTPTIYATRGACGSGNEIYPGREKRGEGWGAVVITSVYITKGLWPL